MSEKGLKHGGRALPHSERAGEITLAPGKRATLYRALRELACSRCAGLIRQGDLFTREVGRAGGPPVVRNCRACVPFETGGELLGALLSDGAADALAKPSASASASEKALSRLGPALAAGRKGRGGRSSEG